MSDTKSALIVPIGRRMYVRDRPQEGCGNPEGDFGIGISAGFSPLSLTGT
jgi:hypothetical protein